MSHADSEKPLYTICGPRMACRVCGARNGDLDGRLVVDAYFYCQLCRPLVSRSIFPEGVTEDLSERQIVNVGDFIETGDAK